MNRNVLEWLENQKDSQKTAYRDFWGSVTFAEVYQKAGRIGSSLKSVKGTSPIAIISGRGIDTICGFFGIVNGLRTVTG